MSAVRAAIAAVALFWALLGSVMAQEVAFPEAGDAVPGKKDVTYLDLFREIVPDASIDADGWLVGTKVIEIRHIAGADSRMDPPAAVKIDTGISALPIHDGKRLMLLAELGQPEGEAAKFAVLALYDMAEKPRLLDVVNVGYDEATFFLTPTFLPLGGGDLILTLSLHFNSGQAYQTTGLTLLRDDRFEYIDAIFTFDDKHCAFERAQQVAIDAPPSDAPFATIDASVTETVVATEEAATCGEDAAKAEPGERTIANAYVWDAAAARYVSETDAFEKLADENRERF